MKCFTILATFMVVIVAALPGRADDTNAVSATIGAAQAAKWIGKQVVVTGVVAQVSFQPGLVFLNFDKAYPNNAFTAVIRARNTNAFENLTTLRGKAISVKGQVKDFKGKPEIEVTGKSQLTVLGGAK
jgi:DNA/RNA endonuclease YhcR with UshA esterase domain